MAFPVPSHPPKRPVPQDVSSKILYKIDAATNGTLDSELASSWLKELDETIQATKDRIQERMQMDISNFKRQFQLSEAIQARLKNLTDNVVALDDDVSDPKSGLIPTLVTRITAHAALAQETTTANVKYNALAHLHKCNMHYKSLTSLAQAGRLPEAVQACIQMEHLIEHCPPGLKATSVLDDLKRNFNAVRASTGEQLSEAYSRSVILSHMELIIYPMVQVRQSKTMLTLSSIMASFSPESSSNHLSTLRRDFTIHFIDHILTQPLSISVSSSDITGHKISLIPAPPNTDNPSARLENLARILTFALTHLFSSFPTHELSKFLRSLSKPITSSLLNNLLIPSLPSSFGLLPSFLGFVKQAVNFEDEYVVKLLRNESCDRVVRNWADGVSGHYERQRRISILENSRLVVISYEDPMDVFEAEVDISNVESAQPTVVPIQTENGDDFKDDAWGFDDDGTTDEMDSTITDVNDGWGLNDKPEQEKAQESGLEPNPEPTQSKETVNGTQGDQDPGDAWGWNDDDENLPPEEEVMEDSVWDDPWSDPSTTNLEPEPETFHPFPSVASPKAATRLEKLASKGKKHLNGDSPSITQHLSRAQLGLHHPSSLLSSHSYEEAQSETSRPKRPTKLTTPRIPKEKYRVSGRTKRIIDLVGEVINEGKQFTMSNLFSTSASGVVPGTIIFQSASSTLELYRALYPVKFNDELRTPEGGMQFSNDCLYLSKEIEKAENETSGSSLNLLQEQLAECKRNLKILSDSWFDETIAKQRQAVNDTLIEGTQGFTNSADEDRYDKYESVVGQVLQDIRRLAQRWRGILAKEKYYTAIGLVTDAALSRILEDILALPDIPEVESHRLSELCRIFNALEGLYSEDPSQPTFAVAYVPCWLKYSYLSELLEASMVDITYLFEEGALVDFEVDELVRLVRALFADTALRTNTISKISGGHSVA